MCHDQPSRPLLCAFVLSLVVPAAASAQFVTVTPVERDPAQELACAPQAPLIAPEIRMQVSGAPQRAQSLYGVGEIVIVNAGSGAGVQAGQQYFIRRIVADRFTEPMKGFQPISVHTAGWLQIQDVQAETATARIVHACDGVQQGDYLEPFAMPVVPVTSRLVAAAPPDFANPAHVILGDERRQMGYAGALMVLDRGTEHGLQPGQRLTFFRTTLGGPGPAWPIGAGTALEIGRSTSVIRIDSSSDAIFVGDLVAIQR